MVSETRKQYTSWFNKEYDKNPGGVAEWTNPNTGKKEKHKLVKAGDSSSKGNESKGDSNMDKPEGSMFGMDNLKSAGASLGSGLAQGIAEDVGGPAMGDAVKAGMASGFNPYVMAGAALMGAFKARKEKKKIRNMGQARALGEKAAGEQKKSDIYGQMAKSIRGSLGGANRKRSVNL